MSSPVMNEGRRRERVSAPPSHPVDVRSFREPGVHRGAVKLGEASTRPGTIWRPIVDLVGSCAASTGMSMSTTSDSMARLPCGLEHGRLAGLTQ